MPTVGISANVSLSLRSYTSGEHLRAAVRFVSDAKGVVEGWQQSKKEPPPREPSTDYTIGAILTSVSFLESAINELYMDCYENQINRAAGSLGDGVRNGLARAWPKVERKAILEKYDRALAIAGRPQFNKSQNPYHDMSSLIVLRHALVHAKPRSVVAFSTIPEQPASEDHLTVRLKEKFPPNPMLGTAPPSHFLHLLWHGCANWAVKSALAYTEEFHRRIGAPPVYEYLRAKLVQDGFLEPSGATQAAGDKPQE